MGMPCWLPDAESKKTKDQTMMKKNILIESKKTKNQTMKTTTKLKAIATVATSIALTSF